MTVTVLLANTVLSAERRHRLMCLPEPLWAE